MLHSLVQRHSWAGLLAVLTLVTSAAAADPPTSTWCARKCSEAEALLADLVKATAEAEAALSRAEAVKPKCARTATRKVMQGGKLRIVAVPVKACESELTTWEASVAAARGRVEDARNGPPGLRALLGALRRLGRIEAGCEELRGLRGGGDPPETASLTDVLAGVALTREALEKLAKLAQAYPELQHLASAAGCAPPGFVRIMPGTFNMGSPTSEEWRATDEVQHSVRITRPFFLQATEVTQGQWKALMGANPSWFSSCGDECPVESVSWDDAVAYCNRLSEKEGLETCYAGSTFKGLTCAGYRLPTEAEWEYAARAGTTGVRYGDLDAVAWHDGNSAESPHPVGRKQPNAWGLYDMLGNVWEWTTDSDGEYSNTSVTDPLGSGDGSRRVIRGGSWGGAGARYKRAAYRGGGVPSTRDFILGLRLARSGR